MKNINLLSLMAFSVVFCACFRLLLCWKSNVSPGSGKTGQCRFPWQDGFYTVLPAKKKKYLSNSCSWFTTLLRESWLTGRPVISVQFWGLYSDYLNLNSCCCSMKLQRVSDQNTTVTSWSSMNQPGQSGHLGHVCSLFRVRTKHREAASQKTVSQLQAEDSCVHIRLWLNQHSDLVKL